MIGSYDEKEFLPTIGHDLMDLDMLLFILAVFVATACAFKRFALVYVCIILGFVPLVYITEFSMSVPVFGEMNIDSLFSIAMVFLILSVC